MISPRALAALLLVLGLAPAAEARIAPVRASIRIEIGALEPIQTEISSFSVNVLPDLAEALITRLTVPVVAIRTTGLTLPVTDPLALPVQGLQATFAQLAGLFDNMEERSLGGVMPLMGVVKACLFAGCSAPVVPARITVPVSVVGNSTLTAMGARRAGFAGSAVNVTVLGAPWTVEVTTVRTPLGVTLETPDGSPAVMTGGKLGTAARGALVSLVTPIFISTSIPAFATIGALGVLDIVFAPEPGLLMTEGAALAALLLLGFRRLRR